MEILKLTEDQIKKLKAQFDSINKGPRDPKDSKIVVVRMVVVDWIDDSVQMERK